MSIVISNGYILDKHWSMGDLAKAAKGLQKEFEAQAKEKLTEFIAGHAAQAHDAAALGEGDMGEEGDRNALQAASALLEKARAECAKGYRRPDVDVEAQALFFPAGRRILMMAICEDREKIERMAEVFGAREYGYWNNTDRPDGVDARSWSRRKRDWSQALNGFKSAPGDCAMALSLCPSFLNESWRPWPEDIEKWLGKNGEKLRERRALDWARNKDLADWLRQTGAELKSSFAPVMEWDRLSRGERSERVERLRAVYGEILPKLDMEGLFSKHLQAVRSQSEGIRRALEEKLSLMALPQSAAPGKKPKL